MEIPAKDPFSASSVNGTFSTSLKGIRQALRKKGRRTEVVVQKVEDEIRGWLSGKGVLEAEAEAEEDGDKCGGEWKVIDDTLVESTFGSVENGTEGETAQNGSGSRGRRMPVRHRLQGSLPPLPISDGTLPAILDL